MVYSKENIQATCVIATKKYIRKLIFLITSMGLVGALLWFHQRSNMRHRTTTYIVTLADWPESDHVSGSNHLETKKQKDRSILKNIGRNENTWKITNEFNASTVTKMSIKKQNIGNDLSSTDDMRSVRRGKERGNPTRLRKMESHLSKSTQGRYSILPFKHEDLTAQNVIVSTEKPQEQLLEVSPNSNMKVTSAQYEVENTSIYAGKDAGWKLEVVEKKKCSISWIRSGQALGKDIVSKIKLDPKRFLLPILKNGPNNQLSELRDSIYIAIRLNRTLVLPQFFKHRTDKQSTKGKYIDAGHRLDLQYLQRLVPVVSLQQFRTSCQGNVQAVLRVRQMTKLYQRVENLLQMNLIDRHNKANRFSFIKEYPLHYQMNRTSKDFVIPPERQALNELYHSELSCAIHPFPFKNLKIPEKTPKGEEPSNSDLTSLSDVELYSEIIRHTRAPLHVKNLASEFFKFVMKGKMYLSVHWRYDKSDWMRSCQTANLKNAEQRIERCHEILALKPDHVARAIAEKVEDVNQLLHISIGDVYIASPPSEKQLVGSLQKILKTKHNYNVYNYKDLMLLWKYRYRSCDWLSRDLNDILSSTEMEICSRGSVFLRSFSSTWSKNVQLARTSDVVPKRFSKEDEGIFELVQRSRSHY